MHQFIVRVSSHVMDKAGFEQSCISAAFVPVEAPSEFEAIERALAWHVDNGVIFEDHNLVWRCNDITRGLVFIADKCLQVTASELDCFLSLTQGLSTALVIGRKARDS